MGNLTTFAIKGATTDSLAAMGKTLVDTFSHNTFGHWVDHNGITVQIMPYVHASDFPVYLLHESKLEQMTIYNSGVEGRRVMNRTLKKLREDDFIDTMDLRVSSIEEALLVATVYHDRLDEIQANPLEFTKSIAYEANRMINNPRTRDSYAVAQTKVQVPISRTAKTLFIGGGNTLTWFDASSPDIIDIKRRVPAFYRKLSEAVRGAANPRN